MLVEEEKKEHLVGRAEELIPLSSLESAADLCISQGQFPVEQTSIIKLGVVELRKRVHSDANLVRYLVEKLRIFLVVRPMTLRQNLDGEVDFESLVGSTARELRA